MLKRSGVIVCALLLGSPMIASAIPVQLKFDGTLVSFSIPDPPAGFSVLAPFSLVVSYDTSAGVLGSNANSQTYAGGSTAFDLFLGPDCDPCSNEGNAAAISSLNVFNDLDVTNDGVANPVDGMSINLITGDLTQRWRFNVSSNDPTALADLALPTALSPKLSGFLQVCDLLPISFPLSPANNAGTFPCDPQGVSLFATLKVSATPVPEPATLSLLGLGLVGLWYGRRKRPDA